MRIVTPAFVGRGDAVTTVATALGTRPALVVIEGESGIGKTRLLSETPGLREDDRTLHATCPPLREPFVLGPVVDGLLRLCAGTGVPDLSPLGGALRPLLPEWVDRLPSPLERLEDHRETRHRLFRALRELVERLGVGVVVVEDAQWADSSTLEWLLMLCASSQSALSLVVTYRPHDVAGGSVLPRLRSRGPRGWEYVRIELGPLDQRDVSELVGSMLPGAEVSAVFSDLLHERTDGNPLAIEETIRLMGDRRELVRRSGAWTHRLLHELPVPPTVRDSVLERIDRLDWNTRQMLWAAAILAAPSDAATLTAVAGLSGPPGRHGIAGGLGASLLRETAGGVFEFRHTLAAKAVEASIPVSVQWTMHRRAAQYLEQMEPRPSVRLARHYREAGDVDAWCHHAEATVAVALESGDDLSAVMTLLELLTSAEHPIDRRSRLARTLGEAAYFGAAVLGDLDGDVVATLGDVLARPELPQGQRGELRLLFGRMLWRSGDEVSAMRELEAAIVDLDHRPDLAVRTMANLAMSALPDWPAARHLSWLARATALVSRTGSQVDKLAVTVGRATTLLLLGDEAGWPAIEEIRAARHDPDLEDLSAVGLLNVAEVSLPWGRSQETRALLNEADDAIRASRRVRYATTSRVVAAYLDWYRGAWTGLREVAADLAALEEADRPDRMRARLLVSLLDVAEAGPAAKESLRNVVTEWTERGIAKPEITMAPAALARLLLIEGSAAAALEVTGPIVDMITAKDVWIWVADFAPVHVQGLISTGRPEAARGWVAWLASRSAGYNAPAPAAALATCRALVAEADQGRDAAVTHYRDAVRRWATLPRPYEELLTRERLGRCLLAVDGHAEEAVRELSETEEQLRRLGAKWDGDRVARLLRERGVEVARTWRRGPRGYGDQLSPREIECVTLVAQGMRNKDVAERLFLSPRTVERHVRSAMRKLKVTTRTALVTVAMDQGVLSAAAVQPSTHR